MVLTIKCGKKVKPAISHKKEVQPAISHQPRMDVARSAVVFFKKHPFEGTLRLRARPSDDKIRMILSRKGHKEVSSGWHRTNEEVFKCIQQRCSSMGVDVPALSHKASSATGVHIIHQLYGLYRDGKEMSGLFKLSSSAWKGYASRHGCQYILWTADEVDTLMQLKAPGWVKNLYTNVRYPVQRCDVARFFILFMYGGLYAELDCFPNLEKFPLVALGLCKMLSTWRWIGIWSL